MNGEGDAYRSCSFPLSFPWAPELPLSGRLFGVFWLIRATLALSATRPERILCVDDY
jgi:hypothetical protein